MLLAACAAQAASREEELAALRARIDSLTEELNGKQALRREARDALRDSERAISQANRTLAALEAESRGLRAEAARLAQRRAALERRLAEQQNAVERMLMARHAGGAPDVLRVALSGDDPAAVGRRLQYAGYLSRAAASLIGRYRDGLQELERLAREGEAKRSRLRAVEQESRADRGKIVKQREARRRVLQHAAVEIRKSRKEIKVLQADEARLARLVAEIRRIVAAPSGEDKFSSLRGRLRLPVRGELTGRFGGLFIRAPQGLPVRAVARGQVVYADWMRGFGNLLIVDHGENYLSIYANAEALLRQVGDAVAGGEPVALTGSSGGNEETGLYFEMRHLGRAFDPLRWVKLK
jgi:septal ring factor EnvC (AmiA/AmiB activator)